MNRPLSTEQRAILERIHSANAGMGEMVDHSPARRELISRRLIQGVQVPGSKRKRYVLTLEGSNALAHAPVKP